MFRLTTSLIVLALAGAPAASLACELWCAGAAAREHHGIVGCHSQTRGAASGAQIAATAAACHDAVSGTPFLSKVRIQTQAPTAALVSHAPLLRSMLSRDPAPAGAHVFDFPVPRSALRSVLRI